MRIDPVEYACRFLDIALDDNERRVYALYFFLFMREHNDEKYMDRFLNYLYLHRKDNRPLEDTLELFVELFDMMPYTPEYEEEYYVDHIQQRRDKAAKDMKESEKRVQEYIEEFSRKMKKAQAKSEGLHSNGMEFRCDGSV